MCRTCGKRHNSYDADPGSNGPQDITVEPAGSIPFSFGLRTPGKTSPLRGRNMKEYEEQLEHYKKENFSLKLRIYFLEEKIAHKGIKEDKEELHKANIELKVETESLKKQLCDKQELVRQAAGLLTTLEDQFKEQLQAARETHEKETEELKLTIAALQKELDEYTSKLNQENEGDLTRLCGLAFSGSADDDVDMPRFNKGCSLSNSHIMPPGPLQGVFSMMEPPVGCNGNQIPDSFLGSPADAFPQDAKNRIKELEEEVGVLMEKVKSLKSTLGEKERESESLKEDIVNLKKELEDREEKVSDLEQEVTEKDQKVDQLMQDLETRHLEIEAKDSTIQTLHEDLNKVEPQIEVKVQEIIEKDRIIEEKKEQLQQQNKILVEIQITLDEKQKQIAELEESLTAEKQKFEKLNEDFDFSLRSIKELADQVVCRDKEISQLKKELKRKEKKVKDLLAELKEALDMLKKAKWEAETSGGQDGVKEMVEEENERLWAELEQRKLELLRLREEKESFTKNAEEREGLLKKEKEEAEEKVLALQKQLSGEVKGERDKVINGDINTLDDRLEARENLVKSQEVVIKGLKLDLIKAKEELTERKEELKDMKKELSMKNADLQNFFSQELFGRNKDLTELQNKLCSMSLEKENPLEALKLLMGASKLGFGPTEEDAAKVSQQQTQIRSNSLSKLSEQQIDKFPGGEEDPATSQTSKAGRSNSFSLLENMLYANMGQKVYNTNQTFNTYVLSGEGDVKQPESVPLSETGSSLQNEPLRLGLGYQSGEHNTSKTVSDCVNNSSDKVNKGSKISVLEGNGDSEVEFCSESNVNEMALQKLYQEVNKIRNEAKALRIDREILTQKVCALQVLNEQLSHTSTAAKEQSRMEQEDKCEKEQMETNKTELENCQSAKKIVSDSKNQIETLKEEFQNSKNKVTLHMLQVASSKFQESLGNYKQEIISLRKRLADSHNACDLLRNRLEELVDFFEQILEMDRRGIINLSHLSSDQRLSLQKSLEDSRSLSHSLSHSLMIGADSVLSDTMVSQNDVEASRYCLPLDSLPEELNLSQLEASCPQADDTVNQSEMNSVDVTNDFLCYSFANKINGQIDEKIDEIETLSNKFNQLSDVIEEKDERLKMKEQQLVTLQNHIVLLRKEIIRRDQALEALPTTLAIGDQTKLNSFYTLGQNESSLFSVSNLRSLVSSNGDSKVEGDILSAHDNSSSSETLPPPNGEFSSQEEPVSFVSAEKPAEVADSLAKKLLPSQSDVCSAYSTDVLVKSLPKQNETTTLLVNEATLQRPCLSGASLERPSMAPTLALASPSESEAWSEPDRNVSLARIGLDACNLVSGSHDRSLSRSRMTRSAPFTSESEGEGNPDEVKEGSVGLGTPSTKPKRRSEAAEIKRLSVKLKTLEQLNETLRAELHIYQTLSRQFDSPKMADSRHGSSVSECIKDGGDKQSECNREDDSGNSVVIPSSLLQEIRSLRMKLEEAIANNDLLRDQLEAALSGYLSEETKSLTMKLAATQQELKCNQEKLIIAASTEQRLRSEAREHEEKMFELSERLADHMTASQKLEKKANELNEDLIKSRKMLNEAEDELQSLRNLREEKELSEKELKDSKTLELEVELSSLKLELKSLRRSEQDKERKIEEHKKYILCLEESKKEYEAKLSEQDSAINKLCQSITTLQQESSQSSISDHLVPKLQEALQNSEGRLLQVTKEKFALLGEKAQLKAQLASVTTHAKLLQREVRELSVSEESVGSDLDYKQIVQRLKTSQTTVKELMRNNEAFVSEKQAMQKEMQIMQEEISALRTHLDHVLSRDTVTNSRERSELASLHLSHESMKEKFESLEKSYSFLVKEKESLESKLKDLKVKDSEICRLNSELKAKEKEISQLKSELELNETKKEEVLSQLESERCLTNNLQMQIKYLQLNSPSYLRVPSDHDLGFTSATSVEYIRPNERTSPSKGSNKSSLPPSPLKETSMIPPWNEDKENHLPRSPRTRGTLSLPHIEDDLTSGDSPDLGISSDGHFSSMERLVARNAKRFISLENRKFESYNGRLCSDPSHSLLLSEMEHLRKEREELSDKLTSTKESLRDALVQLKKANQKKESVERAICKQLSKTHDVLKQAKGHLRHAKNVNEKQSNPNGKNQQVG